MTFSNFFFSTNLVYNFQSNWVIITIFFLCPLSHLMLNFLERENELSSYFNFIKLALFFLYIFLVYMWSTCRQEIYKKKTFWVPTRWNWKTWKFNFSFWVSNTTSVLKPNNPHNRIEWKHISPCIQHKSQFRKVLFSQMNPSQSSLLRLMTFPGSPSGKAKFAH